MRGTHLQLCFALRDFAAFAALVTCTAIDGARRRPPPPHLSLAMAADAAQAMQARAVSLGAPPAMPSYCSSDWVLFKEAKAPVFIIDGGVHLPKLESAKITYAGYFAPVADTSSPLIKMRLRCKCCTTAPGINFHNAIPHTVTLQYVSLFNKLQIQIDVAMGN